MLVFICFFLLILLLFFFILFIFLFGGEGFFAFFVEWWFLHGYWCGSAVWWCVEEAVEDLFVVVVPVVPLFDFFVEFFGFGFGGGVFSEEFFEAFAFFMVFFVHVLVLCFVLLVGVEFVEYDELVVEEFDIVFFGFDLLGEIVYFLVEYFEVLFDSVSGVH